MGPKRYELIMLKLHTIEQFYENWSGDLSRALKNEDGRLQEIPERKYLIQNGFFWYVLVIYNKFRYKSYFGAFHIFISVDYVDTDSDWNC